MLSVTLSDIVDMVRIIAGENTRWQWEIFSPAGEFRSLINHEVQFNIWWTYEKPDSEGLVYLYIVLHLDFKVHPNNSPCNEHHGGCDRRGDEYECEILEQVDKDAEGNSTFQLLV